MIIRYQMTTFTSNGEVFSTGTYKTRKGMIRAKERLNLQYGAHLKAECFAIHSDGTKHSTFCLA